MAGKANPKLIIYGVIAVAVFFSLSKLLKTLGGVATSITGSTAPEPAPLELPAYDGSSLTRASSWYKNFANELEIHMNQFGQSPKYDHKDIFLSLNAHDLRRLIAEFGIRENQSIPFGYWKGHLVDWLKSEYGSFYDMFWFNAVKAHFQKHDAWV